MFKQIIQLLLTGAVICETAFSEQYEYLKVTENQQRVNDFLANLDRNLTYLDSADAFYCTFQEVDQENSAELTALFSDIRTIFRPLVEFLDLLLTASQTDLPLRAKTYFLTRR